VQTQISVYSTTCQKNRYCISVSEWAKVKKLLDFLKIFDDFSTFCQLENVLTIYFSIDAYNQMNNALDELDILKLPIANSLDAAYAHR